MNTRGRTSARLLKKDKMRYYRDKYDNKIQCPHAKCDDYLECLTLTEINELEEQKYTSLICDKCDEVFEIDELVGDIVSFHCPNTLELHGRAGWYDICTNCVEKDIYPKLKTMKRIESRLMIDRRNDGGGSDDDGKEKEKQREQKERKKEKAIKTIKTEDVQMMTDEFKENVTNNDDNKGDSKGRKRKRNDCDIVSPPNKHRRKTLPTTSQNNSKSPRASKRNRNVIENVTISNATMACSMTAHQKELVGTKKSKSLSSKKEEKRKKDLKSKGKVSNERNETIDFKLPPIEQIQEMGAQMPPQLQPQLKPQIVARHEEQEPPASSLVMPQTMGKGVVAPAPARLKVKWGLLPPGATTPGSFGDIKMENDGISMEKIVESSEALTAIDFSNNWKERFEDLEYASKMYSIFQSELLFVESLENKVENENDFSSLLKSINYYDEDDVTKLISISSLTMRERELLLKCMNDRQFIEKVAICGEYMDMSTNKINEKYRNMNQETFLKGMNTSYHCHRVNQIICQWKFNPMAEQIIFEERIDDEKDRIVIEQVYDHLVRHLSQMGDSKIHYVLQKTENGWNELNKIGYNCQLLPLYRTPRYKYDKNEMMKEELLIIRLAINLAIRDFKIVRYAQQLTSLAQGRVPLNNVNPCTIDEKSVWFNLNWSMICNMVGLAHEKRNSQLCECITVLNSQCGRARGLVNEMNDIYETAMKRNDFKTMEAARRELYRLKLRFIDYNKIDAFSLYPLRMLISQFYDISDFGINMNDKYQFCQTLISCEEHYLRHCFAHICPLIDNFLNISMDNDCSNENGRWSKYLKKNGKMKKDKDNKHYADKRKHGHKHKHENKSKNKGKTEEKNKENEMINGNDEIDVKMDGIGHGKSKRLSTIEWKKRHEKGKRIEMKDVYCDYDEIGQAIDLLVLDKTSKVLDLGCGTSMLSPLMVLRSNFIDIECLDLSQKVLKEHRKRWRHVYGDDIAKLQLIEHCIRYKEGDMFSLTQIEDSYFDVIIAKGVFDFVEFPQNDKKNFLYKLKHGGLLIVLTSNHNIISYINQTINRNGFELKCIQRIGLNSAKAGQKVYLMAFRKGSLMS